MQQRGRGWRSVLVVLGALVAAAPAGSGCVRPGVGSDLELRRIVLYRNGVGYFERSGEVDDDELHFQVRRDQVGDFLSSLAVVTRDQGGVRGVSFPSFEEPEPPAPPPPCYLGPGECPAPAPPPRPSNMLDVVVEMDGEDHDVTVAYVVEAPVWRPTYRIVLGEAHDSALLQGWAVVQNLSGEDWTDVELTVTEGAPLTFRADLATPYIPARPVVSDYGEIVQAPVSSLVSIGGAAQGYAPPAATSGPMGGSGSAYGDSDSDSIADAYDMCPYEAETWNGSTDEDGCPDYGSVMVTDNSYGYGYGDYGAVATGEARMAPGAYGVYAATTPAMPAPPPPPPAMGATGAGQSLALLAARAQEGGITTYEAEGAVTVPNDSSTLIAILNDPIDAEDTLLYQPDYGVPDSSQSPFRVIRFTNDMGVALERGPMAILGHGQFLGQGILEPLPSGATTSIPYALERGVMVTVDAQESPEEARLVKIVHGRVTVQRFSVLTTTYEVRNLAEEDHKLWIRHARRLGYDLPDPPEGTEETGDGSALMPLLLPAGEETELKVEEKSPTTVEVELLTPIAHDAILAYLNGPAVDAVAGPVLRRALEAGDRLAEMDERRAALEEKRREVQQLMQEVRADLSVLGTNPRAQELKDRLMRDLDEQTRQYQDLTAQIVDLNSQAAELRVELAEAIRALDLEVPQGEGASP
ncbi:MAG: DUF4139 domain-containing protein [Deltaproteobacteria bacterium]|nr:DUF4139 domain-containing protein [Deltaproteobacteria bacterium]